MVLPGMEYATRLILELCGGEASTPIVAGALPAPPRPFTFRLEQLKRLAGIALEPDVVEGHLRALGFGTARQGEQVLRDAADLAPRCHHGSGRGRGAVPPARLRPRAADAGAAHRGGRPSDAHPEQRFRSAARRSLANRGLAEAVTWSFVEPELAERFGGGAPACATRSTRSCRCCAELLPNLLSAAVRNQNRDLPDVALFELGRASSACGPARRRSRRAASGSAASTSGIGPSRAPVDVFDARADAVAALAACRLKPTRCACVPEGPGHYHPGRRGRLMLGPQTVLAEFGELHPAIVRAHGDRRPVVGFEVFLERVPRPKARVRARGRRSRSPLPPVDRDFAFVVDDAVRRRPCSPQCAPRTRC